MPSPDETVIKVHPAMCRNRGCNRPVHWHALVAYAKERAFSHESVDLTWCMQCNAKYLEQSRHNPGEPPVLEDGSYFDEEKTMWPKGSY